MICSPARRHVAATGFVTSSPLHRLLLRKRRSYCTRSVHSMRWITSTEFFEKLKLPESKFVQIAPCQFSEIPQVYWKLFSEFRIEPWKTFNSKASKFLAGKEREQRLPHEDLIVHQWNARSWSNSFEPPVCEKQLELPFTSGLLMPANHFQHSSREVWGFTCKRYKDSLFMGRTPHYSLRRKITVIEGNEERIVDRDPRLLVVGDLQTPCVTLGSDLNARMLTERLHMRGAEKVPELRPFIEIFSYILRSEKGVGFLTNYDCTRYFKINLKDKTLLMSPVVRIDQVLDQKENVPHPIQAFMYITRIDYPTRDELSQSRAEELTREAANEIKEEERKQKEKEASEAGKQSKSRASVASGNGNNGGKERSTSEYETFSEVSRVLGECKTMGRAGVGVTGDVSECDLDGVKVAVKVGLPFSIRHGDARDYFYHVEREIKMYNILKELQGDVIPRVIVGGIERCYLPCAMVLIMEKVGEEVNFIKEGKGKIYVGGKELNRENLMAMREKGVEGLERMNECGVVHFDSQVSNTRVEMRNGKVDRVWWIDFGDAGVVNYETEMVRYENETGLVETKYRGTALERCVNVYVDKIDECLEALDSCNLDGE